jgi:aminoglycoside phosphotransferase (APT) family kinase protein
MAHDRFEDREVFAAGPSEETLEGGGVNIVVRIGDTVRRPVHPWTPTVHSLLAAVRAQGFTGVPAVHGYDEQGREILDFVEGAVGNYPLTDEVRSVEALVSAAKLLRGFHDATMHCVADLDEGWQQPALESVVVICHSDFAPYNCVFRDGQAVALIDFDMARPGPRSWDLAYALYRFAPFTAPENPDGFGNIEMQASRARRFLDAYGCTRELRAGAMNAVVPRLRALVDFMREAAEHDANFAGHIEAGHLDLYLTDIAYVENHREALDRVVISS